MSRRSFDVVFISDPRLRGGTNASLAEEIAAQSAAGYSTALLPIASMITTNPGPLAGRLEELRASGQVEIVRPDEPVDTRLLISRSPALFRDAPQVPFRIKAERAIMVANAFPSSEDVTRAWYDPSAVHDRLEDVADVPWTWSPLSAVVRDSLRVHSPELPLAAGDWPNVLDPDAWRIPDRQPIGDPIVVGRHSRPQPQKWPADRREVLAAYPDDPSFRVMIMGGTVNVNSLPHRLPKNWQSLPFDALPVREFLRRIDLFVYFHHPDWQEAFGRAILEAIATGAIAIVPPYLERVFGPAALYTRPNGVAEIARTLRDDPDAAIRTRDEATQVVRDRFSHAAHVARLNDLIGPPAKRTGPASVTTGRRPASIDNVLFFTDNTHGLGHVTRLLAVARRMPASVRPVFLTMSEAHHLISEAGHPVEYTPSARRLGILKRDWAPLLERRLAGMLERVRPTAVLVDHVAPSEAFGAVRDRYPDVRFLWSRRGLWKPARNYKGIELATMFDEVIEPLDVASGVDSGYTGLDDGGIHYVDPITLMDPPDLVPRHTAREALGLDPDRPAVLIQLSDGETSRLQAMIEQVHRTLESLAGYQAFAPLHVLHSSGLRPVRGLQMKPIYPLSQYLNAFDLAVSTAGYNSFHEVVMAGVPTVFVARQSVTLDDQYRRAEFAELAGFGWHAESVGDSTFGRALQRAIDPLERRLVAAGLRAIYPGNGAAQVANLIASPQRARQPVVSQERG